MGPKHLAALLLLVASWLLIQMFAHDYVVQKQQTHQQNQQQLIEQQRWHQTWPMDQWDEVVSSFQSDWQLTASGLQSDSLQPAISLVFNQQQIDPPIHQQLDLNWALDGQAGPDAVVKIEFSNQQQQWFFESPEIPLSAFNEPLDLSQFSWQFKRPAHQPAPTMQMDWQSLGTLDGLVLRFYFVQPRQLTLSSVAVLQTHEKTWESPPVIDCTAVYEQPWLCLVTNQIRYKTQHWAGTQPNQALQFTPLLPWSAWWILLGSMVTLLLSLRLLAGYFHPSAGFFVATLYGITACLHMGWLGHWSDGLLWLVLVLAIGLFWLHRQWFLRPAQVAWLVWLGTAVVFLAMWLNSVPEDHWWLALPQYLLWACWQQLLLGPLASDFFNNRLSAPRWLVAVLVGVLFSMIHAPNHSLMLATLLAGICWSYSWMRYQNIYANAISHALLALMFYQFMPVDWLGSARIGVFF